jgi:hypothetical protein
MVQKQAAVLQKEINIGDPQNETNFLTNSTSVGFSKRAKLSGCIYGTSTNSYMSLSNEKIVLQQSQNKRAPNFLYALLQMPKKEYPCTLAPFKPNTQLCNEMIPLVDIQI